MSNRTKADKRYLRYMWVFAGYTVMMLAVLAANKIDPANSAFTLTCGGESVWLLVLGIWSWLVLGFIFLAAMRLGQIQFTRQNCIVFLSVLLLTAGYYAYNLLTREFIYYWDYSTYYNIQLTLKETFYVNSFYAALKEVVSSVWYADYSSFISIFVAVPFTFTNQTPNWFVASSAITILPWLYLTLAVVIKTIEKTFRVEKGGLFFACCFCIAACFPLMHRALLYGQPDLFGLILVFLIVSLTLRYDFSKTEWLRYALLIALTIMLCASRRWYLYWLVSYYACYGVFVLAKAIIQKQWKSLLHMLIFAAFAGAFLFLTLSPFFRRILSYNYADNYSYYNSGGFPYELKNQYGNLGLGLLIFMTGGFVWGLVSKKARAITAIAFLHGVLSVYLFTRVQNMGFHQSLILVPAYLTFLFLCAAAVCEIKKKSLLSCAAVTVTGFCVLNAGVCAASDSPTPARVFSAIALKLPQRDDIEQVNEVNAWLEEACSGESGVYMIPHGTLYNPDVFRSASLPDRTIQSILPYGSAILGTHKFPKGLLSAKYILTCTPFCNASIAYKYNDAFLSKIPHSHFIEKTRFDMGNGYVFIVYERVIPADMEELNYYESCLAEERELYPDMFEPVFDELESWIQG